MASTSKPAHIVLFTKEGCPPCTKTKGYLQGLLEADAAEGHYYNFKELLSQFEVEKDSVFREIYNLNMFPTLVVLSSEGLEVDRVVGGKKIRNVLHGLLVALRRDIEVNS